MGDTHTDAALFASFFERFLERHNELHQDLNRTLVRMETVLEGHAKWGDRIDALESYRDQTQGALALVKFAVGTSFASLVVHIYNFIKG